MDMFLVAADDVCGGLGPIVSTVKNLFNIIKIIIPIALLIMGVIDLSKAVLASDEKEIKAAQGKFIKRAIAAVAVFFAVTLVDAVIGLIGSDDADTTGWFQCWNSR